MRGNGTAAGREEGLEPLVIIQGHHLDVESKSQWLSAVDQRLQ